MATVDPGGINVRTFFSLPFIILILSNVGMWLATNGSTLSPHYAYLFTAGSAAAYALARGFAKWNSDGRPFWQTTEFYVIVIGAVIAAWGGFRGHMSPGLFTAVAAALASALVVADGLRTPPAKAVGVSGP